MTATQVSEVPGKRAVIMPWPEVAERGAILFPGSVVMCAQDLPMEASEFDDVVIINPDANKLEASCHNLVAMQTRLIRGSTDDISHFKTREQVLEWHSKGGLKDYRAGVFAQPQSQAPQSSRRICHGESNTASVGSVHVPDVQKGTDGANGILGTASKGNAGARGAVPKNVHKPAGGAVPDGPERAGIPSIGNARNNGSESNDIPTGAEAERDHGYLAPIANRDNDDAAESALLSIRTASAQIRQASESYDPGEWPDPQPLPSELLPVVPFDYDLLPQALRGWVRDIAERVQCPPEFPAVGAIVALGSVLGRKISVRPKARDDWEEFPNLWGAIIGRPGVLKSPALNAALAPLRKLDARACEAHLAEAAEYRAELEARRVRQAAARGKAKTAAMKGQNFDAKGLVLADDEGGPEPRRYIVNDSTVPALCRVLQHNPNGVLAFRDELSGLLRGMEREGAEGDRAFYLSAYSGKEPHTVDRIGTGLNQRIEHCCVSILGSIQPHVIGRDLREAINGAGADGLLARFSLLVWPDTSADWQNVDRWPDTEHRKTVNYLFDYLDSLNPANIGAEQGDEGGTPFLRFDDAAAACFLEWRTAYERKQRESEEHPALIAHFAKYRKLVPALALIFHLTERTPGPIPKAAVLMALGWLEMLESHARRAYASVQQSRIEAARTLLKRIRKGDVPNPFSLRRDVVLKGWGGVSETEDARQAAGLLEELDYLRREDIPNTGGRPKTVYWISPKVRP